MLSLFAMGCRANQVRLLETVLDLSLAGNSSAELIVTTAANITRVEFTKRIGQTFDAWSFQSGNPNTFKNSTRLLDVNDVSITIFGSGDAIDSDTARDESIAASPYVVDVTGKPLPLHIIVPDATVGDNTGGISWDIAVYGYG